MNFLKTMIVGNRQDPDNVNVEEVAALIDDAESEIGSQADAFNKLALIQSRIKGTQSDAENLEDPAEPGMEQISDFSDAVRDVKETSAAAAEIEEEAPDAADETVLAPIMTEEDFSNLDDELARMSEELEEQETAQGDKQPDLRAALTQPPAAPPPPVAAKPARVFESRTAETAKVLETAKGAVPKASSILISEKMGGGSVPTATPVSAMPEPATPEPPAPEPVPPEAATPEPVPPEAATSGAPDEIIKTEPAVKIQPVAKTEPAPIVAVPAPAAGRSGRRAGRIKTRLLGFEHGNGERSDPFAAEKEQVVSNQTEFPVGWIIVVEGPGYGTAFALFNGVSQIGRGDDQAIKLDYGDNSISRENHAAVAYDSETNKFFLGHGGKANLVRLNDNPVLSTEEIKNADVIRIGETTLRLVALCGENFNWDADGKEDQGDAGIA